MYDDGILDEQLKGVMDWTHREGGIPPRGGEGVEREGRCEVHILDGQMDGSP